MPVTGVLGTREYCGQNGQQPFCDGSPLLGAQRARCSLYFLYSLPSSPRTTLLNLACHLGFSLEREGVVSHKLIEGQRLTSGEPLDVVRHATGFAFSIESLQVE